MKRLFGKDGDDKKKMEAKLFPRQSKPPKPRSNIPGPSKGKWFHPEKPRNRKIEELIKTERDYVRDLKLAVDYYYVPLKYLTREKGKLSSVMPSELVEKTFGTFPALVRKHDKFSLDLRRLWAVSDDECAISNLVKSLLLDRELLKLYVKYAKDASVALKEVDRAYDKNTILEKYDRKVKGKMATDGVNFDVRLVNLSQFAMKPMQRVTRYGMFMEDLAKLTERFHPDFAGLQEAKIVSQVFLQCVNDGQRDLSTRVAAKIKSELGRTISASSSLTRSNSSATASSWEDISHNGASTSLATSKVEDSALGAPTFKNVSKDSSRFPNSKGTNKKIKKKSLRKSVKPVKIVKDRQIKIKKKKV